MFALRDKFWRAAAALGIASMLYLGHGLHTAKSFNELPELPGSILQGAEGNQVLVYGAKTLVTVSDDGKEIHFWKLGALDEGIPKLETQRSYKIK